MPDQPTTPNGKFAPFTAYEDRQLYVLQYWLTGREWLTATDPATLARTQEFLDLAQAVAPAFRYRLHPVNALAPLPVDPPGSPVRPNPDAARTGPKKRSNNAQSGSNRHDTRKGH